MFKSWTNNHIYIYEDANNLKIFGFSVQVRPSAYLNKLKRN